MKKLIICLLTIMVSACATSPTSTKVNIGNPGTITGVIYALPKTKIKAEIKYTLKGELKADLDESADVRWNDNARLDFNSIEVSSMLLPDLNKLYAIDTTSVSKSFFVANKQSYELNAMGFLTKAENTTKDQTSNAITGATKLLAKIAEPGFAPQGLNRRGASITEKKQRIDRFSSQQRDVFDRLMKYLTKPLPSDAANAKQYFATIASLENSLKVLAARIKELKAELKALTTVKVENSVISYVCFIEPDQLNISKRMDCPNLDKVNDKIANYLFNLHQSVGTNNFNDAAEVRSTLESQQDLPKHFSIRFAGKHINSATPTNEEGNIGEYYVYLQPQVVNTQLEDSNGTLLAEQTMSVAQFGFHGLLPIAKKSFGSVSTTFETDANNGGLKSYAVDAVESTSANDLFETLQSVRDNLDGQSDLEKLQEENELLEEQKKNLELKEQVKKAQEGSDN